jgi:hypothetical protein
MSKSAGEPAARRSGGRSARNSRRYLPSEKAAMATGGGGRDGGGRAGPGRFSRRAFLRLTAALAALGLASAALLGRAVSAAALQAPFPFPFPEEPPSVPRTVCDETFVCDSYDECDEILDGRRLVCHKLRVVRFCSAAFPEIECDHQVVDLGAANCCG